MIYVIGEVIPSKFKAIVVYCLCCLGTRCSETSFPPHTHVIHVLLLKREKVFIIEWLQFGAKLENPNSLVIWSLICTFITAIWFWTRAVLAISSLFIMWDTMWAFPPISYFNQWGSSRCDHSLRKTTSLLSYLSDVLNSPFISQDAIFSLFINLAMVKAQSRPQSFDLWNNKVSVINLVYLKTR